MSTMTSEREAFEKWYAENAFNYGRDPIGSRESGLQWAAWQARAHVSQPAQAVDVGAILNVIEQMRKASMQRAMPPHYQGGCYTAWIDALTSAISGGAGPVGDGWQPIETAPKDKRILCVWLGAPGCEEVDVAVNCTETTRGQVVGWCSPHDCDDRYCAPDYWMPIKPLPASPAPDKEG